MADCDQMALHLYSELLFKALGLLCWWLHVTTIQTLKSSSGVLRVCVTVTVWHSKTQLCLKAAYSVDIKYLEVEMLNQFWLNLCSLCVQSTSSSNPLQLFSCRVKGADCVNSSDFTPIGKTISLVKLYETLLQKCSYW